MAKKPKPEYPPGCYRPTTLRLANRRCAGAVEFYDDPTPDHRRIFQHGTAAHAILEKIGRETNRRQRILDTPEIDDLARAVCGVLIEKGRTFDGIPEPPLVPDRVYAGRDMALEWVAKRPLKPDGSLYEVGLAVDINWKPVPYFLRNGKVNPAARFRCILDIVNMGDEADEEGVERVITITDYKSPWSATEDVLDELQLRSQAVMAWLNFGPEIDMIVRRVVNLRRLQVYEDTVWMGGGGEETLEEWRLDLDQQMKALDRAREMGRGKLITNPGEGCIGCPYLDRCSAALELIEHAPDQIQHPVWRAQAYAAVIGRIQGLKDRLFEDTREEPVDIGDALVGTLPKKKRVLRDGFHHDIGDEWCLHSGGATKLLETLAARWPEMEPEEIFRELVRTVDDYRARDVAALLFAMKPSLTSVTNLAKTLFPKTTQRAERDAWVEGLVEYENTRSFRVERKTLALLEALKASLEEQVADDKKKETAK